MTLQIKPSERDLIALREAYLPPPPLSQVDFSKKVVRKPWGYEYLMLQTPSTGTWFLHINSGDTTSFHCHVEKKTALVVLAGTVLCTTFSGEFTLKAGEAILFDKKVFHSTRALSPTGARLVEIETPPLKTDLVRYSDRYGRERKGYEQIEQTDSSVTNYLYVTFEKNNYNVSHSCGETQITLAQLPLTSEIREKIKITDSLFILLEGTLPSPEGGTCRAGDILTKELLLSLTSEQKATFFIFT